MIVSRLLADENFPRPVVEHLRGLGHNVLTLNDIGYVGQGVSDPSVLDLATADNRAVLTINRRDFVRLHLARTVHAGIIVCTFDSDFVGQATRIAAAIKGDEPLAGRLIRVNRPAPGGLAP